MWFPLYARLAEVNRDIMQRPIKVITVEREYGSRGLYHMLLNSCMGFGAMIEAVQGAAGLATCPEETVAGRHG
jgi:hypothetical protein